jgi:hypothetical protein
MKKMIPLRIVALCSNLAFLIYAVSLHLFPILLLHALLLPINTWRLSEASKLPLRLNWHSGIRRQPIGNEATTALVTKETT